MFCLVARWMRPPSSLRNMLDISRSLWFPSRFQRLQCSLLLSQQLLLFSRHFSRRPYLSPCRKHPLRYWHEKLYFLTIERCCNEVRSFFWSVCFEVCLWFSWLGDTGGRTTSWLILSPLLRFQPWLPKTELSGQAAWLLDPWTVHLSASHIIVNTHTTTILQAYRILFIYSIHENLLQWTNDFHHEHSYYYIPLCSE